MNNDLISREALIKTVEDLYEYAELDEVLDVIKDAPTVKPQKIVTIPPELIEKLASCVVNTIEKIDWDKAIEAYKERPQGKWIEVPVKRDILYPNGIKYVCSACKRDNCYGKTPFCIWCGATMKTEEEEQHGSQ